MGQGVGPLKGGGGAGTPLQTWGLPSFMESRQSEFFRFFRVKLQEHTDLKLT